MIPELGPDPERETTNEWTTVESGRSCSIVEEREGRLFGYEMKWGKAKVKPPTEWQAAYPEAAFSSELLNSP